MSATHPNNTLPQNINMTNANLSTMTNSPSSLNIQVMIPSLNFPLLQSKRNFPLLQSKGKTQALILCCRQTQHQLLVIDQCLSSKFYPHQSSEHSSLSHHHSQS